MSDSQHKKQFIQLGVNVARYRKLRGYTQQELADAVSISRTHLSNLEAPNKVAGVSLEKLFAIAKVLNVPCSDLLKFID